MEATPERVFAASLSVELHLASMRRHRERMVRGPDSDRFAEGDTVTWAARHGGIPFRMTSWVHDIVKPHSFVDEQIRGPFARFHHQHFFAPADDNSQHTLMTDVISYRAPLGFVGALVERAVLDRHLRHLILARNQELVSALAAGWTPPDGV